jgi:hypothetical protein
MRHITLDATELLAVGKQTGETVRWGRRRKDDQTPAIPLRRLTVNLTDQDFCRIDAIRKLTGVSTIADVLRDSVRVYDQVLKAAGEGGAEPPENVSEGENEKFLP